MTSPRGFYPAVETDPWRGPSEKNGSRQFPAPSITRNYCSGNTPIYHLGIYLLGTVLHSPISFSTCCMLLSQECRGSSLEFFLRVFLAKVNKNAFRGKWESDCLLNCTQENTFFSKNVSRKGAPEHTICIGNNLATRVTSWAGIWCQSNQGMNTSCAFLQGSVQPATPSNTQHKKGTQNNKHHDAVVVWTAVIVMMFQFFQFLLDMSTHTVPVWFHNFHSAPSIWAWSRLCPVKGVFLTNVTCCCQTLSFCKAQKQLWL